MVGAGEEGEWLKNILETYLAVFFYVDWRRTKFNKGEFFFVEVMGNPRFFCCKCVVY